MNYNDKMKAELGEVNFKLYSEMKKVREMTNVPQTRLPFTFFIH